MQVRASGHRQPTHSPLPAPGQQTPMTNTDVLGKKTLRAVTGRLRLRDTQAARCLSARCPPSPRVSRSLQHPHPCGLGGPHPQLLGDLLPMQVAVLGRDGLQLLQLRPGPLLLVDAGVLPVLPELPDLLRAATAFKLQRPPRSCHWQQPCRESRRSIQAPGLVQPNP